MKELTDFERYVIEQKGTERPFSGEYDSHYAKGRYLCKKCASPLYLSEDKFRSQCGWPAFDDEIAGAIIRVNDPDGHRTEVICASCRGHLGHVFIGEGITDKNTRHCVNSISLVFESVIEHSNSADSESRVKEEVSVATMGGGCFWCTEAVFSALNGVLKVTPGYAGGTQLEANYQQVCSGNTEHAEVIQLEFDPNIIDYSQLLEVFWQSHDPTSYHQQGHDVGPQYRSIIFVHNEEQRQLASSMLAALDKSGLWSKGIVTEIVDFDEFYPAEAYHQDYYANNQQAAYCQIVIGPKMEKIRAVFADKLKP